MTDTENTHEHHDANEEHSDSTRSHAERIVREASDVRERIGKLVSETFDSASAGAKTLEQVTQDVLEGAERGVTNLEGQQREDSMAQVFHGLSDGLSKASNSARLAFEEAASRGRSFAENDVNQAVSDLKAVQQMLGETLERLARRVSSETQQAATDLITHARRASDAAREPIARAIDAARDHPASAVQQTAQAGFSAARSGLGALLDSVGDLLRNETRGSDSDRNSGDKTPD